MSGGSAPSAKKSRIADETRNDEPTSSGGAQNSFSRDGARKAALTFQIDDYNAFKNSTERLEGEKISLGGFQWHIRCYVTDGMLSVVVVATHPTQAVWHCKAEFGLRAETDRDYYSKSIGIVDNTCPAWGWVKLTSVHNVGRFLEGNTFKVSVEVRVFNCYVTDGAYGIGSRFHDVAFIFSDDRNKRIHGNKGFLAANSEFFEGMFFGSFADKDQDEVRLKGLKADAFASFLIAIAPGAPSIKKTNIVTLLRMADRFQAPQLTEQCLDVILKNAHVKLPFVQKLQLADELELSLFRDTLVATATEAELDNAIKLENAEKFSKITWVKLCVKQRNVYLADE